MSSPKNKKGHNKSTSKSYESLSYDIRKLYEKIKNSFDTVNYNKNYTEMKILFDNENKAIEQIFEAISSYVRLNIEEKTKFISQSNFEIINIDDVINDLYKRNGFNQNNFKTLIQTMKNNVSIRKEDILYIESLKQTIIDLEKEKKYIISSCEIKFNEQKEYILKLIEKIDYLDKEKILVEDKMNDLVLKIGKLELQEVENKNLRQEINRLRLEYNKEKTKIIVSKNLEMKNLNKQLKNMCNVEKKNDNLMMDNCVLKNWLKEEKLEKSKINTVSLIYFIRNLDFFHAKYLKYQMI